MQKCIILSIIACTLVSSNTTLSMFRLLRAQKCSASKKFYTTRTIGSLPEKNIHNSSEMEIAENAGLLVEDMCQRNEKLAELLQQQINKSQSLLEDVKEQNRIAINYTFNGDSLDVKELKKWEKSIREKAKSFYNPHDFNSLFSEKKYRGHPNE